MCSDKSVKQLRFVVWLLVANLLVLALGVAGLVFGLLPKMERAISAAERMEDRFQSFADDVQPVLSAGAGKAIETIKNMDAERLSETATEKTDSLMGSAADRAKRFLERDKVEKNP